MKRIVYIACLACFTHAAMAQSGAVVNKINKAAPVNTSSAKVKALAMELNKLLLLNDVVAVTGMDAKEIKTKYSKVLKNPTYHELQYLWPSDRIKEVETPFVTMKVPVDNKISIRGVEEMDLKKFNSFYRNLSEAEKKEAMAVIDNALNKDSRLKDHTQEQKTSAKSMASGFMNDPEKYEEVAGIGTRALWKGNELFVLKGNVKFVLYCEVSKDKQVNLDQAKQIAQSILKRI